MTLVDTNVILDLVTADERRLGGTRERILGDFYVGAHAQAEGLALLTRDAARYRTYFPKVKLIAPD